jgi:hypothetical protein
MPSSLASHYIKYDLTKLSVTSTKKPLNKWRVNSKLDRIRKEASVDISNVRAVLCGRSEVL